MSDLLLDFTNYLVSNNIVQGDGIDCFRDRVPDNPDECAYMFEYRSHPSGIGNFGTRWIQFNYRSKSYNLAKTKCVQIFKLFGIAEEDTRISLTTDRWVLIHCQSGPFKNGVDAQGRVTFTFNTKVSTYYE